MACSDWALSMVIIWVAVVKDQLGRWHEEAGGLLRRLLRSPRKDVVAILPEVAAVSREVADYSPL